MIKIIFTGKTKNKPLETLTEEYLKRLKRFTKIEILEIKDEKITKNKNIKDIEADRIIPKLKGYTIALDEKGKQFTSIEFAKFIQKKELNNLTFIVGGALGLSDKIKPDLTLSFSKMTFNHKMIRPFLLEQIYRAYCINKGIDYHK